MDSPTGVWPAALLQMRTHSWASAMASLSQVYSATIKWPAWSARSVSYMSVSCILSENIMQQKQNNNCNSFCLFPSGISRGGDDSLRSSDLHPSRRCGLCPACGQMALPAEECLGWLLLHTGSPFVSGFSCLLLRSTIFLWSNQIKQGKQQQFLKLFSFSSLLCLL